MSMMNRSCQGRPYPMRRSRNPSCLVSFSCYVWKAVGAHVVNRQAHGYHVEGVNALLNSQFEDVIKESNKAIAEDHTFVNTYKGHAQAYRFLGNLALVAMDFGAALSLNPRDGDAYLRRGRAY